MKKTNVLDSVNLTDWLMTCLVSSVMQILLGKRKTHSFCIFYSKKNKNPLINFAPLHDLAPKPTQLFYIVKKCIRLSGQIEVHFSNL